MYAQAPSADELEGTGLTPADYEEVAEVWPDNWMVFSLFCLMQTQWDVGMAGPSGLKYPVLFEIMDRQRIEGDAWWETFDLIREMEDAALNSMRGHDV